MYYRKDALAEAIVAVHLKSTSRADSTPALIRALSLAPKDLKPNNYEYGRILFCKGNDNNIIILGDCNDSPAQKQKCIGHIINSETFFLTYDDEAAHTARYRRLIIL